MMVLGPRTVTAMDWRAQTIRSLFTPSISAAYADDSELPQTFVVAEMASVANAIPSRRREFALGRQCAHAALAELDVITPAILVGSDRAPVWPCNIVAAITHCAGFVGAVAAHKTRLSGLGFDVESATPLGDDLVHMICTPSEIEWAAAAPPPTPADWAKVLFSAKESVHKCIFPLTGVMLDFVDVAISIGPSFDRFSAELVGGRRDALPHFARLSGRLSVTHDLVFTGAVIPSIDE